jgi:hypothetical protein
MSFNITKCKVMHLSRETQEGYTMRGTKLETTKEERDIGVTVSSNLRHSALCSKAAGTTSAELGQISRACH